MNAASVYLEAAFTLAVTGAALSPYPWSALIVAAAFFGLLAFVVDRRQAPSQGEQ